MRHPKIYTKTAGFMLLVSILAGVFGEIIVSSILIVPNDANATALKIQESIALYRYGFASYLIEAICDVSLALIFYQLLKPVIKEISLLAVFFGIMATATFAFAELFYFIVTIILDGNYLTSFTQAQTNELIALSIKIYSYGAGIFMLFYGIAAILRGYLIYRSGYLPKFLGALLIFGGICFLVRNFILVLAPPYADDLFLLPMLLAMLTLSIWLLVKGVDIENWNKKVIKTAITN